MSKPVQVGDHDPEFFVKPGITPQRRAELHFVRKLASTALELRDASKGFDDATTLFLFAQANESFDGTLEAAEFVLRFADRIAETAGKIKTATESIQESKR